MTHHTTIEIPIRRMSGIALSHTRKAGLSVRHDIEGTEKPRFVIPRPTMPARICPGHTAQVQQLLTERIRIFVQGNLKNRVTLKELARFLGYSEKYSSEFFQIQMGTRFSQYVKRLRIMKAKHMLAGDAGSVTHIAEALGFSDSFAFSHFFKRVVGCSPTAFRKQQLNLADLR